MKKNKILTKNGSIPFWLVMLIYSLISLIVIIFIIYLARGKLGEFLANIY